MFLKRPPGHSSHDVNTCNIICTLLELLSWSNIHQPPSNKTLHLQLTCCMSVSSFSLCHCCQQSIEVYPKNFAHSPCFYMLIFRCYVLWYGSFHPALHLWNVFTLTKKNTYQNQPSWKHAGTAALASVKTFWLALAHSWFHWYVGIFPQNGQHSLRSYHEGCRIISFLDERYIGI